MAPGSRRATRQLHGRAGLLSRALGPRRRFPVGRPEDGHHDWADGPACVPSPLDVETKSADGDSEMNACLGFGFATTFYQALFFRCLVGLLNSDVGVMRSVWAAPQSPPCASVLL